MKRLHIHVAVSDLDQAVQFYNTLFDQKASVVKDDYAKWLVDDPAINFAISARGNQPGLNHMGIQVDNDNDLEALTQRLSQADIGLMADLDAQCCYSHTDKYWTRDPAGIPWENFHTLGEIRTFHGDAANKATPGDLETNEGDSEGARCCN